MTYWYTDKWGGAEISTDPWNGLVPWTDGALFVPDSPEFFEAIVNWDGSEDYLTFQDAIADGKKRLRIQGNVVDIFNPFTIIPNITGLYVSVEGTWDVTWVHPLLNLVISGDFLMQIVGRGGRIIDRWWIFIRWGFFVPWGWESNVLISDIEYIVDWPWGMSYEIWSNITLRHENTWWPIYIVKSSNIRLRELLNTGLNTVDGVNIGIETSLHSGIDIEGRKLTNCGLSQRSFTASTTSSIKWQALVNCFANTLEGTKITNCDWVDTILSQIYTWTFVPPNICTITGSRSDNLTANVLIEDSTISGNSITNIDILAENTTIYGNVSENITIQAGSVDNMVNNNIRKKWTSLTITDGGTNTQILNNLV